MKYGQKFILAMFNKSKSGKSWLYIDSNKMYMISDSVYNMVKSGEILEIEFSANGELKNDDGTVAFNTFRVKDWTESIVARLASKMREVEAIEMYDADRYEAAVAKAKALGI